MTTIRNLAACAAAALVVACGGGSNSATSPAPTPTPTPTPSLQRGIAVPTEISALPARTGASAGNAALRSRLSAVPATSDYALAPSSKYVDERALSQFDVFNTIFKAMAQTHYADAENLGAGPYGAMVTWEEDKGDSQSKQLVPWVVDSSLVTVDGRAANRVRAWMLITMGDGLPRVIKVKVDVFTAPTRRDDGTYADYGEWRIDAKFDESGSQFFSATATRAADGTSVVMLHESEHGEEVRGILRRADAAGSGKVSFPDYQSCQSQGCTPAASTVAYVYDATAVALQQAGGPATFKNRTAVVDLVNRYGLYDAATGADVSRSHSFGFPLKYTDPSGVQRYAYYGAWQGRHQLWADGASALPAGTTVTRGDQKPGDAPQTFTTSAPFVGTLVKRTLVPADVQDVRGLVVETWLNESRRLRWSGSAWVECGLQDPSCSSPTPFTDFAAIAFNPTDTRRSVFMSTWSQQAGQPQNLVYVAGGGAPGFYLASGGNGGPLQPTSTPFSPSLGQEVWVNINGSVYISFDGTSWVQKTLVSFDPSTWTPTFDPSGDHPYTLELGREVYINNPGANYVVKRTGGSTYDVKIELQSVANPVNAAAFAPAGTELRPQWGGTGASTFRFVTDSSSPRFLKLVYKTVGSDAPGGAAVGDVVTTGQWGLVAYDANGASTGVQFNWDTPRDGESFGTVQYLVAADGSYRLLDDPIRLAPISLTTAGGETKTFGLQFDGSWVNGLPNLWDELRRASFEVSPGLAAKVVSIPAGTEVVDAADPSRHYLFKPLQTAEYLTTIADPGNLDLATANALDLSTVPTFVDHGMGPTPAVPVKYSEGALVQ